MNHICDRKMSGSVLPWDELQPQLRFVNALYHNFEANCFCLPGLSRWGEAGRGGARRACRRFMRRAFISRAAGGRCVKCSNRQVAYLSPVFLTDSMRVLTLKNTVVTICTTCVCISPNQCIYVFRVVLIIECDYLPKQH
jgi:hypothetical protein